MPGPEKPGPGKRGAAPRRRAKEKPEPEKRGSEAGDGGTGSGRRAPESLWKYRKDTKSRFTGLRKVSIITP